MIHRTCRRASPISVLLTLLIGSTVALGAATQLVLIPLPPAPYRSFFVADINARGDVLGATHSRTTTDGAYLLQAALYSPRRGFSFPPHPAGLIFNPQGLNDRGDIAGWMRDPSDENWIIHGALLEHDGTFSLIDVPGTWLTILSDVNARGEVVGYYAGDGGDTAFRYYQGTFAPLGSPPDGDFNVVPHAIANNGTIVGSYGGEFDSRGFILRDGRFTTVAYPGAGWTVLTGITAAGTIVGAAAFRLEDDPDGHGPWTGFLYRDGIFDELGTGVFPEGINAAGVVAGSVTMGEQVRGFTMRSRP